ncbi:uncharacterized protein LOC101849502 [Aplysia californica]|uniref:Uncharacterized protein LOC101849502 n=1 Tax=Aplysia californica TaxID=6500 RepID=A0ABM1W291_APLCA|nr:uncharacterized protein LOC101849502 [Aplysia californica]
MLSRAGTVVRKQRRRSSTASRHSARRESGATPSPSLCPTPSPYPSPSPSPSIQGLGGGDGGSCRLYPGSHSMSRSPSPCLTPLPGPHTYLKAGHFTFDARSLNGHISPGKLTPPPCDKPLYESTVVWAELDEGDTHYSVVASLSEAGNEARHPCDFIHRSMFILSGTWPVTVFLLILLALPLVMTTIGVNYLHECPREPKLPIYLVVGGCFGILKLLFLLWKQIRRHRDDVLDLHDDEDLLTMTRMTNMALNVFLSVWFVFGHYWLIRIWEPHFEAPLHEPRNWCDRTVFTFTFWQLVICHVILGILILVAMVLYCCYICIKCGPNSGNESLVGLDSSSVVRDASRVDAHGEKKNNDVTVMDSHGDTDDCVTNMDAKTPLGFQRPPPKR